MAKTATSPQRSRRTSAAVVRPLNHSLESVDGEDESLEVTSSNKKFKSTRLPSSSPELSPVPSTPPQQESEELKPVVVAAAAAQPEPELAPAVEKQQQQRDPTLDICPICLNVPEEQRKRNSLSQESWVACEQCEQWFHWHCIRDDLAKGIAAGDLETWYCKNCIEASIQDPARETLTVKLKESKRKSSRKKPEVDYVKEDPPQQAPPGPKPGSSKVNPWKAVAESRPLTRTHFRKMRAEQLTIQWLESDPTAFCEPIFIETPEGLDMKVLPVEIKISEIADLVGRDWPIDVIDVASQSGLHNWTLGRWADYYEDPNREKVRNVISLELSNSAIKDRVASPKLVRQIDWVEQHWPGDLKAEGICPQVTKYCLMSPGESWTDWHIDFSASSVFYHILRGRKVFYFISPTPDNLRKYEIWSGSETQSGTWLGDQCDRVYRVELKPGNTLIIPSGWIHCVYTPVDALVIGGNFLHSYNIATELRVYQIELNTKVPKKFRFPYFVPMCWYVGWHFYRILETEKAKHTLKGTEAITRRVLQGVKALADFLVEQTYRIRPGAKGISAERRRVANENIPWQLIDDPTQMAEELQSMAYTALGEEDKIPRLMDDDIPKFDAANYIDGSAYDYLKEQYATSETPAKNAAKTNSTISSNKRKASVTGQTTHLPNGSNAKTAKFRHFSAGPSQTKGGLPGGSASRTASPALGWPTAERSGVSLSPFERVERQSFEPVTTVSRQRRERPAIAVPKTPLEFEYPNPPRRQEVEVEVKSTTHQNIMRKIVPGEEEGSWVVETRKVCTTIERIYFPPPRRPNHSGAIAAAAAAASPAAVTTRADSIQPNESVADMDIDERPTISEEPGHQNLNHTNGSSETLDNAASLMNGSGNAPHEEISRMLGLVNGSGTSL